MSTFRQRYEKWCKGDDIEDCTHKQRCEESYQSMVKVLQQNTWIDESRALLGRYLNDLRVPWRHKRREMMAIAGTILSAKWFAKFKRRSDVGCRLRNKECEQCGTSAENLPSETYGHINNAFCDEMTTNITVAHHFM